MRTGMKSNVVCFQLVLIFVTLNINSITVNFIWQLSNDTLICVYLFYKYMYDRDKIYYSFWKIQEALIC